MITCLGAVSIWNFSAGKSLYEILKLSSPDRVDVPPDRTDHHLDELHDHGRLRLPLHLRDRLHQLHPVHGVHLRRVRRGQANKIFKPFSDR